MTLDDYHEKIMASDDIEEVKKAFNMVFLHYMATNRNVALRHQVYRDEVIGGEASTAQSEKNKSKA